MPPMSPWTWFVLNVLAAALIAGGGAVGVALTGDDPANEVQWILVGAITLGAIGKEIKALMSEPPK